MLYKGGISTLGELWGKSLIEYQPEENDIVDLLKLYFNKIYLFKE